MRELLHARILTWASLNIISLLLLITTISYLFIFPTVHQHWISIPRNANADDIELDWLQAQHALPHPLDIALRVAHGNLKWNPPIANFLPGYGTMRPGTFRDKYPSERMTEHNTFDEIFVITNERCHKQLLEFKTRANAANLKYTVVQAVSGREVDLAFDTPASSSSSLSMSNKDAVTTAGAGAVLGVNVTVDVANLTKVEVALLKRQVGYAMTHRKIWEGAKMKNRQRILVIDDTLFPKERLLRMLPNVMTRVDQESVAGAQPWHVLYLRRVVMDEDWVSMNETFWEGDEEVWCANGRDPVVRAKPSYGAGMYAMSANGIELMLDVFTEYRVPIEVQLAQIQRERPRGMIALSLCAAANPNCADLVMEISIPESSNAYECMWRRVHDGKPNNNNNPF